MKKIFLSIIMVSTLLISCSKDSDNDITKPKPPPPPPPITEEAKIPISITAKKNDDSDTSFKSGDKVGLYMVNYNGSSAGKLTSSGNQVDNIYFSYSGNWTPEKKIYWKDKSTKAEFFCYFPYKSNIANVAALPIAVKENQSSEENYKASEFLWGKTTGVTPTESTVNITLEYANSKLIIKLVAGEGYSQEDLKSAEVVIGELKLEATINLATGEVAAKGNASDIKPKMENDLYHALVIPQSAENIDLIKVTIDNKTYLLNQSIDFASNKQYTCTINIDRSSQGVVIGIEGWDIDDREYGNEIGNI